MTEQKPSCIYYSNSFSFYSLNRNQWNSYFRDTYKEIFTASLNESNLAYSAEPEHWLQFCGEFFKAN